MSRLYRDGKLLPNYSIPVEDQNPKDPTQVMGRTRGNRLTFPAPASTPTPSATPSPKFAAPTQELNPGYPWQYNLLQFQDNQLTVYTRRREEKNGAWKPDAHWGQGAGKSSLDRYEIQL